MTPLHFTHRPTVIAGQSEPDRDRQVLLNGHAIGRALYYDKGAPETYRWQWSTGTRPVMNGVEDSLGECLAAIRDAVSDMVDDGWLPMAVPKDLWLGIV